MYYPDNTPNSTYYALGTVANYSCDDGYVLVGNETRTCVDNGDNNTVGVFSGQDPTCVRKLTHTQ